MTDMFVKTFMRLYQCPVLFCILNETAIQSFHFRIIWCENQFNSHHLNTCWIDRVELPKYSTSVRSNIMTSTHTRAHTHTQCHLLRNRMWISNEMKWMWANKQTSKVHCCKHCTRWISLKTASLTFYMQNVDEQIVIIS